MGASASSLPAAPSAARPAPCAGAAALAASDPGARSPSDAAAPSSGGDCPVPEEYRGRHGIFNVYNQRIDATADANAGASSTPSPSNAGWFRGYAFSSSSSSATQLDPRNNMPAAPRQEMAPGQRRRISTARQASTIPKSGTGSTWTYPSPQMFYNSLVRKGKAEDCTEDDMASVVSVHNAMNEDTWRRVVAWEKLHRDECENPMLLRFLGRPNDLSPLAWARYLTTGAKPFDRHDWYVDRGGKQVRYVIDYYFDETRAGRPGQFDLVVRPAADSLESVVDRVKMAVYVGCAMVGVPCPISGNNAEIGREIADRNETAPEA